jgi:hypothetical protein
LQRNALFLTTLVLAITIWGSPVVDAQEDAGAKTELSSAQASAADPTHEAATKFAVSAAYYGELITHPGFSLGMEYYFFENKWFAAFVSPVRIVRGTAWWARLPAEVDSRGQGLQPGFGRKHLIEICCRFSHIEG